MKHSQCYEAYTSLGNVKKCIKEGHHVLVLMRGVSGSGKSHLANELRSVRDDGLVLSTDNYFMVAGEYKFNRGMLDEYHKKTQAAAKKAIYDDEKLVIIDNTNIQWQHMRSYAIHAVAKGFEIYVVEPNNEWSRKAGQCAARNIHGVDKEQIKHSLDQLDKEQNPRLQDLVPKGYSIVLNPVMDLDHDEPMYTSTPMKPVLSLGPPPGLPAFSLAHNPNPVTKKVEMRSMETHATEVIVALSLNGLPDMFDDVTEGDIFEHERLVATPETKDRRTQAPSDIRKDKQSEIGDDLDLLVSIYPSEDMATLQHNYEKYGLSTTIQFNLDCGIMPDFTTDVVKGAFDPEIAKALTSGSFEPEARIDNSDANTSSTDSDYQSGTSGDRIHRVDLGAGFVSQLEDIFGAASKSSSSSTIILSETILRDIFDAVNCQRSIDSTEGTENDALIAQQLQEEENASGSYQPAASDELSGAQHLQFADLKKEFPGIAEKELRDFFKQCGNSASQTRDLLYGHEGKPKSNSSIVYAPQPRFSYSLPLPNTPGRKARGHGSTSPVAPSRRNNTSGHFAEPHRLAKILIEKANVIKTKKDELLKEAHMQSSNGKTYKNATADERRRKAREYDKQEKALRAEADAILYEANARSRNFLDLHFFTYSAASNLVKERLGQLDRPENARRGPSNMKLTIVTGHGQSTGGTGVVHKQVENYIKSRNYTFCHENQGCIVVTCK